MGYVTWGSGQNGENTRLLLGMASVDTESYPLGWEESVLRREALAQNIVLHNSQQRLHKLHSYKHGQGTIISDATKSLI